MIGVVIASVVLAVLLFWQTDNMKDYFLTSANISRISPSDLEDGQALHGRLDMLLGSYAERTERTFYGLPEHAGTYYIVPLADDTYMSVYFDEKYEAQAENIMAETLDYLNGSRTEKPEGIFTRGMLHEMEPGEKSYFAEWFFDNASLIEAEERINLVTCVYEVVPFSEWCSSRDLAICMMVIILLVAALVPLLWMVTGMDIAGVKKTIKKNGWNMEEIEADILSGTEKGNLILGRKYLLSKTGWRWKLSRLWDIIWVYSVTQTQGTVKYIIYLYSRNVSRDKIYVRKEETVHEIMEFLEQTQPHILQGYSGELNTISRTNYNHLIQLSDEKASL